jgi:ABC-type transport system involved in Fe-S cluster assembly fused permease/ATPase subunit
MAKADLRRNIGYVSQDRVLINDTIFNNIIWGKLGASEAEVIEASQKGDAHDFIVQMEKGYDTVIGESGNRLSGAAAATRVSPRISWGFSDFNFRRSDVGIGFREPAGDLPGD